MFYADVQMNAGSTLPVTSGYEERAFFVVEGEIELVSEEEAFSAGQLVILKPDSEIVLRSAHGNARLMLLGGEPIGHRYIYWNFVSSSQERIEQAKRDWRERNFAPVPGETEFIPLPPDLGRPVIVRYP